MPELSTQYLSSPSHQALYRVDPRRRTSQGLIMWDGLVAENRMMESWAELTGCAVQVGHNHDLQKTHLIPYSNTNTACQRLRFTFSHPLLVQATCPLYCNVSGYTFARRPVYSPGALCCNVSGDMFSSLQYDLLSGYVPFSLQIWPFLYFGKVVLSIKHKIPQVAHISHH